MMELEKQVTSLETSKRLKELGVPQGSLFCWVKHESWKFFELNSEEFMDENFGIPLKNFEKYSAFTVAELGELLKMEGYFTRVNTVSGTWCVRHVNGWNEIPEDFDTEAEARGKMLIHLIENKLWTPGRG